VIAIVPTYLYITSFPRSALERNVQTLCVDSLTAERPASVFPRRAWEQGQTLTGNRSS